MSTLWMRSNGPILPIIYSYDLSKSTVNHVIVYQYRPSVVLFQFASLTQKNDSPISLIVLIKSVQRTFRWNTNGVSASVQWKNTFLGHRLLYRCLAAVLLAIFCLSNAWYTYTVHYNARLNLVGWVKREQMRLHGGKFILVNCRYINSMTKIDIILNTCIDKMYKISQCFYCYHHFLV